LKNQLVSNYSTDPGLGIGMAYMIKWEPYEKYAKSRASEADVSVLHDLMLPRLPILLKGKSLWRL